MSVRLSVRLSVRPCQLIPTWIGLREMRGLSVHIRLFFQPHKTFPAKADQSGARQHAYEHAHAIANSKIDNR